MSRRNLILLIIILAVAIIAVVGFLYFRQGAIPTTGDPEGTNFFDQFNPFGDSGPGTTTPPTDISGEEPTGEEVAASSKLSKVSTMGVAGFISYTKERMRAAETPAASGSTKPPSTEFVTAVRYVEKATGNIYQTFADKIEEKKFSKTIIPKIYEAYFGSRGESVVMRYLKADDQTIETFVGTLPKEFLGTETSGGAEVQGSFLPQNITDMSVSPDTSKIFYLSPVGEGVVGLTLNFADKRKVQVFESPFTEWLSSWPNANTVIVTTKPSANVGGYAYAINVNNKNLSSILGGISGLTTVVSPSGKLILYSDNTLSLSIYHTDTRETQTLGIKTLAEKCVWEKTNISIYCSVPKAIPFGQYPDSWYQGEVSFTDELWKIDVTNGNTTLLADPAFTTSGEEVDGIKLALDEKSDYLLFVNKKDSFLWKLELK